MLDTNTLLNMTNDNTLLNMTNDNTLLNMTNDNTLLTLFILICYHIPWFLRDKTNINKSVNIISLNSSFFTSLMSLLFILTQNELYLSLVANVFIVGLFTDFVYTLIYYPNHIDPLLTMTHHPFYIFFTFYTISINKVNLLAFFLLQEIPTVVLNIKRYYNIKNIKIDYLFGFLFLLFRIIYHLYVSYYFKDDITNNKILLFVIIMSFVLHCYWFYGWIKKFLIKNDKNTNKLTKNNKLNKLTKQNKLTKNNKQNKLTKNNNIINSKNI
jgi:hypothetical protein